MTLTTRLRIDRIGGDHVHFSVFVGPAGQARAKAGEMCLRREEYAAFAARLDGEADSVETWEREVADPLSWGRPHGNVVSLLRRSPPDEAWHPPNVLGLLVETDGHWTVFIGDGKVPANRLGTRDDLEAAALSLCSHLRVNMPALSRVPNA